MQRKALIVSGIIFDAIGVLHLLRLAFKLEVVIGGHTVPLWVSIIGFIVPTLLALWMFKSARQD